MSDKVLPSPYQEDTPTFRPQPDSIKNLKEKQAATYPIFCSTRLVVVILAYFGFFVTYVLRTCINMALVGMVNQTVIKAVTQKPDGISQFRNNTTGPKDDCERNDITYAIEKGEFEWSKELQGVILGSFYYGYMCGQIPEGWLGLIFGGKKIIAVSMCISGVLTLLMPIGARYHYGVLIGLRVVTGLCQASTFSCMQAIYSQWIPPHERSRLIGFAYSGTQLGNVGGGLISGLLCQYCGWDIVFYTWGAVTLVWAVAWFVLVYDSPEVHPRILPAEKQYIQAHLPFQRGVLRINEIPWKSIVTSIPLWSIFVTHSCTNYVAAIFNVQLPIFISNTLKVPLKINAIYASVPFVGMAVMTIFCGQLSDYLKLKTSLTMTGIRKLFTVLGSMGTAIMLVVTVNVGCQHAPVVASIFLAVTFCGCQFGGGYIVNIQDIAARYSSLLFGIVNTVGTLPIFLATQINSRMTKAGLSQEWKLVFYINAGISSFAAIVYFFTASGETQPWALAKPNEDSTEINQENPALQKKISAKLSRIISAADLPLPTLES